ncbi:hypothetical protein OEB99_13745 [Actinotalea sp. M2MS4P-6]|uniref:hypothetical protein n=1 Tax=Actinotalea sp. M2MS4P-6 TaxID=2983762 RepID=UPI0021E378E9|nr:hypothetical protein [Actinotalea sp. M2MS4P-6]MCV2395375.1 hypothetical protein [Actinotalea sp. M2MS4P-6]
MEHIDMSPQAVAEAIERSRIELLNQGPWSELRESERTVRLDVLMRAMAAGGVTAGLAQLRARADAVDDLSARLAELRETSARERIEHEQRVATLNDRVAELRRKVEQAEAQRAAAQEYIDELETVMKGAERAPVSPDADGTAPRGLLGRMRTGAKR